MSFNTIKILLFKEFKFNHEKITSIDTKRRGLILHLLISGKHLFMICICVWMKHVLGIIKCVKWNLCTGWQWRCTWEGFIKPNHWKRKWIQCVKWNFWCAELQEKDAPKPRMGFIDLGVWIICRDKKTNSMRQMGLVCCIASEDGIHKYSLILLFGHSYVYAFMYSLAIISSQKLGQIQHLRLRSLFSNICYNPAAVFSIHIFHNSIGELWAIEHIRGIICLNMILWNFSV